MCISLNADEHWTGRYRPGYPRTESGTFLYVDEDGNPVFGDIPELECPLEDQLTDDGETEIFKVNIRIQGYDLEGENPIEIVECDLSGETAGVGTISIYQTINIVLMQELTPLSVVHGLGMVYHIVEVLYLVVQTIPTTFNLNLLK